MPGTVRYHLHTADIQQLQHPITPEALPALAIGSKALLRWACLQVARLPIRYAMQFKY